MQKFHLPDLFTGLPWQVRFALIAGGTLISAFSNRLPDFLQDTGLGCGIALVVYGVLASIWHWINEWRRLDIRKWLRDYIVESRNRLAEWRKAPRLNPPLSVIVLLIAITVVGAWLNNGKVPTEVTTSPNASHTGAPTIPIVNKLPGSLFWEFEDTLALLDAAQQAYSETRTTFAAHLAEANDATDDQILLWYSYAIINFSEVWGTRPPSDKLEPLNLKGFALSSNTRVIDAPIPGFSASYIELRVPKDALPAVIEKIRALDSKPDWAPATTIISAEQPHMPATPVPTSVRILFGPEAVPPKEIFSQNVKWRAIEETGYGIKALSITDPDWASCYGQSIGMPSEKCYVPYKFLELVLSFPKPITFKNIKITAVQGGDVPSWKQVIITETDAVIRFELYPADKLLDIEAADEESK